VEKFKNYPAAACCPPVFWPVGQTIRETLTVRLPDALPTGNYTVTLGLYDEATGERLSVPDNLKGGKLDEVIISSAIEVKG
jgi:hypothetical protein